MARQILIRTRDGRVQGPFDADKVRSWISAGKVREDMEFSEDGTSWAPGSEWPDLFDRPRSGRRAAPRGKSAKNHQPLVIAMAAVVVLIGIIAVATQGPPNPSEDDILTAFRQGAVTDLAEIESELGPASKSWEVNWEGPGGQTIREYFANAMLGIWEKTQAELEARLRARDESGIWLQRLLQGRDKALAEWKDKIATEMQDMHAGVESVFAWQASDTQNWVALSFRREGQKFTFLKTDLAQWYLIDIPELK